MTFYVGPSVDSVPTPYPSKYRSACSAPEGKMDDLLDLNWSSTPSSNSTNTSKPISPNPPTSRPVGNAQFDFLAKSSTGGTSGTSSPNYYNASTTPRSFTPTVQAAKPSAVAGHPPKVPVAAPASNGNDAFSSLLGMSSSGANGSKNMTLAQRQAQMADEKRRKEEQERQQFSGLGHWETTGSSVGAGSGLASTSSGHRSVSPLQPVPTKAASSFDALLQPVSRPASSASRTTPGLPQHSIGRSAISGLEDDDFMVASSSKAKNGQSSHSGLSPQPADPWDFDQLAAVKPVQASRRQGNGRSSRGDNSGMRTPDPNFDFGDWQDEDEEEQGILSSSRASPDFARRFDDQVRGSAEHRNV